MEFNIIFIWTKAHWWTYFFLLFYYFVFLEKIPNARHDIFIFSVYHRIYSSFIHSFVQNLFLMVWCNDAMMQWCNNVHILYLSFILFFVINKHVFLYMYVNLYDSAISTSKQWSKSVESFKKFETKHFKPDFSANLGWYSHSASRDFFIYTYKHIR